jgi:hypothetical protein
VTHDKKACFQGFLRFLTVAALLGVTLWHCGGCAANKTEIERQVNQVTDNVVKPAVEKFVAELSARTAQIQGQGSLINPGYEVAGFVSFGPATTYKFTIQTIGVSANLAAAGQADAGQEATVKPPALRDGGG